MAKRTDIPSEELREFKSWCCAKGGSIAKGTYGEAFRVVLKKGICVFYGDGDKVSASGRALKMFKQFQKESKA